MMQPRLELITIDDNVNKINQLMHELVLQPRIKALAWSAITKQTPNMKIGYPGQHLASLVVGMVGSKTGARGNDIVDGSEVKSCSNIDAMDKCNSCGEKISRAELRCPVCDSDSINRSNDSKWLFTIRSEDDLKLLTEDVNRIILVLADYPHFDRGDYSTLKFQFFEIWTNSSRCKAFKAIMTDYYQNVYSVHRSKNSSKTPAPQNFWPYSYHFYKSNPIKVFSFEVINANNNPSIINGNYVPPGQDRSSIASELMPSKLLKATEFISMLSSAPKSIVLPNLIDSNTYDALMFLVNAGNKDNSKYCAHLNYVDEPLREFLPNRNATGFTIATKHVRR